METRASPGRNWVRFVAAAVIAAAVAIGIFRLISPAATLEVQLEDRIRIAFSDPASGQDARISLVTIDEATMATLPYRSPVDRGLLADVVAILNAAGARAVGLDILLDQPTEPEKDARLADALRSFAGDAVLAWADARAGMTEAQSAWLTGFLDAAGATAGFVNLRHDADGVVRRHIVALTGTDLPSFSEALAGGDGRLDPVGRIDWRLPQSNGAPVFQETPAHVLPLMAANPQILRTWFEGRIVLVGASLPQQDRHPTPVSTILGTMQTTGLHIHAQVIAQLLDQRQLPELAAWQRIGYIFAMAAIASALASLPLALAMRVCLLSGVVALHLGCIYLAFDTTGVILPVATALTAILLSAAGSLGVDAVLAHQGRRYVRQAFGHYLAPALVDHLVRNPAELRLGGERRRMTFLFTDLAGFTSMSERMEAEKIAELL
ncbi:MAG: CHASE2 domain-containing protein, partial [Pseudomonadota bacterium]